VLLRPSGHKSGTGYIKLSLIRSLIATLLSVIAFETEVFKDIFQAFGKISSCPTLSRFTLIQDSTSLSFEVT
jgi:hypothetical protein